MSLVARTAPVAVSLGVLALTGCATAGANLASRRAQAAGAQSEQATGVWDWVFRSTDDQGDMRVEQEEWHLTQRGAQIDGYYDRSVTMMSVDERLFRCNEKLGFTKVTRVRVAGQVEGTRIVLREISFEAKPGPCDDGARNLVSYVGIVKGPTLALRWGPEAGQTLVRRADNTPSSPIAGTGGLKAPTLSTQLGTVQASQTSLSLPLGGTWTWELRSIDAEGDERTEREEWHLTETETGISGYYDRTVVRVRGDGTFTCNAKGQYETATRYTISGQRFGDKLTLTEVDYQTQPSRCDNALRRLDTYQGQLADAENLILSWGPGNQLLRRKH